MRITQLKFGMMAFMLFIVLHSKAQDDAAIKKLVQSETDAYFKKDSASWSAGWAKDPSTTRTFTSILGTTTQKGWDSISANNFAYFRNSPKPDSVEVVADSFNIRKMGNVAVVDYKQTLKFLNNAAPFNKFNTLEQRVITKKNGKWQIVSQSTTDVSQIGENGNELMLNAVGYSLMGLGKNDDAIKVLELNTKLFPNSFNVFDSLGEAYAKAGNKELAVQNYEKSIALNPENTSGKKALEKLK